MSFHLLSFAFVALAACVHEVDLREPVATPLVCAEGEREDPVTAACAPCLVRSPRPEGVCNCGHLDNPRPFPYCDSVDADYDCAPCAGGVEACATYGKVDPSATDCQRLRDCCAELDGAQGATPCCPPSETVFCEIASGSNALVFSCVSDS